MGLYLNPGNEEFRNAAIHSKIYVDKTEMIKFTNSQLFGEQKKHLCQQTTAFWKINGSQYAGGILQQRLRFEGIV